MSETFRDPQSANEAILQNILGAQNVLREPQSVVEFYLQKILEQGSGSSVVANPTLEGTEEALSGLEVDGTKYKVESGGGLAAPLYLHFVYGPTSSSENVYFHFINSSAQPTAWKGSGYHFAANGSFTGNDVKWIVTHIYFEDNNYKIGGYRMDIAAASSSLSTRLVGFLTETIIAL